MRRVVRTSLLFTCLWLAPSPACAESAIACPSFAIYPLELEIPANLPGFLALGRSSSSEPVRFGLFEQVGSGETEWPLEVRELRPGAHALVPLEVMHPGSTYVVRVVDPACPWGEASSSFVVRDAVPVPSELGTTLVSGLLAANFGAPGPEQRSYFVLVTLELTERASAAGTMFDSDVLLDGELAYWNLEALHERPFRLLVGCPGGAPLAPGVHTFQHRATSWDEAIELETAPVEREIRCDGAVRVDPSDYHPLTPEEIEEADRPRDDGVSIDAGALRDGGPHDSAPGGCACRAAPPARGASWASLLCVLAIALRVRRGSRRP